MPVSVTVAVAVLVGVSVGMGVLVVRGVTVNVAVLVGRGVAVSVGTCTMSVGRDVKVGATVGVTIGKPSPHAVNSNATITNIHPR